MSSENEKVSITLRIDRQIVEEFKRLAEQTPGGKYQAFMNYALKDYLEHGGKNDVEARLARLELTIFKKQK